MNEELQNEIEAINSIYGSDSLVATDSCDVYILRLPLQDTSLRLRFPSKYPSTPPFDGGVGPAPALANGEDSDAHPEYAGLRAEQLVPWAQSDVVVEMKSVFVARSAPVSSPDEARSYLQRLLESDKKVRSATHNITAWRIKGENGVAYQDCDDDGETAAGGRVLHLMQLMDIWNAMVVVTRWYGGHQLGPKRFSVINAVARDALVKARFVQEENSGGKKKGKR
ncbi:UPF0029-domain-containing protein [Diplocarpon rosae]|nr:UPF0029-domain-containing protein [Diplocarpon rosae]